MRASNPTRQGEVFAERRIAMSVSSETAAGAIKPFPADRDGAFRPYGNGRWLDETSGQTVLDTATEAVIAVGYAGGDVTSVSSDGVLDAAIDTAEGAVQSHNGSVFY